MSFLSCRRCPDAKVRMYLVYLKYRTLNLMPLMVYPTVLFHPNFSIKASLFNSLDGAPLIACLSFCPHQSVPAANCETLIVTLPTLLSAVGCIRAAMIAASSRSGASRRSVHTDTHISTHKT